MKAKVHEPAGYFLSTMVGALVEAATAELKLLVGVGLGVGQLPAITYRSGPTCSTPAHGILPKLALAMATVAKEY